MPTKVVDSREQPLSQASRAFGWIPRWSDARPGVGVEHLLVSDGQADGLVIAPDEASGFVRLNYRLRWNSRWRLHDATFELHREDSQTGRSLHLRADRTGTWKDRCGNPIEGLDGCTGIDIWPTPFTKTFPIRRDRLAIGERREVRVVWIDGTSLTARSLAQVYTRLDERHYRVESVGAPAPSGDFFVDDEDVVIDFPGHFQRV
ncbi:putative glycolipid-binding domain-containing protein [Roseateles sp. NT4]|uniref:putative glycolipid-binding domain-containing protein n=1 Tax=Roseateles sp. NT4 TaxID=3453715 RepID=UPI003EE881EF